MWDKLDTRVVGGLTRITGDNLNCVIFIGQESSTRIKIGSWPLTLWYCGVFPHSSWGEHRAVRAKLLENILDQIAAGTWISFCSGNEIQHEISTVHLLATYRSLPSLALGDWTLGRHNIKIPGSLPGSIKIDTYRLHTS